MGPFNKKKESRFKAFLDKLPFRQKENFTSKHAIHFHNFTQFGGALNDNIFKYLIVFLLIALKGVDASSEILFWVGIIYVLPFLLFSSGAGVLADRFSKQRLILILKFTEIVIIFLSFFAFTFKSEWACYTLMFLLSMQSALFGPSKYSIIPELVEKKLISRANGIITSSTYLAIIIGTFLGTWVTLITDKNFTLAALVPFVIALAGFITSLFIPYTAPKGTKQKMSPLFIYEIYQTLRFCALRPHLFVSIFSSAFFLFVGAFVQLQIIPFSVKALDLSPEAGGYLFLVTAIGIAGGAVVAGRLCKKEINLGIPCLSSFLMAILFIVLDYISTSLAGVITTLIIIGFVGGLFIVPFDSFIQTNSPEKRRGQIIAAANFLSFCGVAVAPISIYLFGGVFKLSPQASFFTVGWIILLVSFIIFMGLGRLSFNFFAKRFLKPFFNVQEIHSPFEEKAPLLLFMPHYTRFRSYLLMALSPEIELLFFKKKKGFFDPLLYFITSYKWVYYQDDPFHSMQKVLESDWLRSQRGAVTLVAFHTLPEKEALHLEPFLKRTHHIYRRVDMDFSFTTNYRWLRFWKLIDLVITYRK